MKGYSSLIWDWNGTLLNDVQACVDLLNHFLEKRKLPQIDKAHYRAIFRFPVIELYQDLGFDVSQGVWDALALDFFRAYQENFPRMTLFEGAKATLQEIARRGYQQFVLSALPHAALEQHLEHFGLRPFFKGICGNTNVHGHSKEDVGKKWMVKEGIDPRSTLMIGDTHHDYDVAQALGCDCVLMTHGHQDETQLAPIPTRKFSSYQDLLSLF